MSSLVLPPVGVMSAAENREEDGGQEEEERRVTKRKMSMSNCIVCQSEEAKYRCPACLTHSCSLSCVKKHKEDSGCSGVRDKTAFVSLSQFDEMSLLSDYRFLEDTGRFTDGATRDRLVRSPHSTFKTKRLAACARKMNLTLRFLPITFTRSRENSTFFLSKMALLLNPHCSCINMASPCVIYWGEKKFMWHLKLLFPQSGTEFSQRRVSESQTLQQILTPYIHPTESDPVTRQKLKIYVLAPSDDVKVFMKAEGRKANSVRYHELNVQKTLRDNLSYKTLIEYPVLDVVLREHWKEYPPKGPAVPASARSSFAARGEGVDQKQEDATHGSQGADICAGSRVTSPDAEPPREKRAKRESKEEEEEGEIVDSSEEEEEEDEEVGHAERPVSGMLAVEDDSVDTCSDITGSNADDTTEKTVGVMTTEDAAE